MRRTCGHALATLTLLLSITLPHSEADARQAHGLYEMRGVWLTTAFRLDWPPNTTNVAQQQQALLQIIQDAQDKELNTIFFQVVARGDAMYQSSRLPWSPYLTGSPGGDPGWDPLQFAISEVRLRGMELHAWYNVYLVGHKTSVPKSGSSNPPHIVFAEPTWIREDGNNEWLDPALPDARQWLVDNIVELVTNYDVDGVHFDYIRYAAKGGYGTDSQMFTQHNPNNIATMDDWRRDNVTQFVRDVYPVIRSIKPWVKVGTAAIGNYKWYSGAPPAQWAYNDVYQESRLWLQDGIHDYLVPQMYFAIGNDPEPGNAHASPDFDFTVRGWMDERHNRHIMAGTGPWKEIVRDELPRQIDTTRAVSAFGQVYFRNQHISPDPFGGRYALRTLTPPMAWLNPSAPNVSGSLTRTRDETEQTETISWNPASASPDDPRRGYAVFRREGEQPDVSNPLDLAAMAGSDQTSITFNYQGAVVNQASAEAAAPGSIDETYYRVVAVSRLGGASPPIGLMPLPVELAGFYAVQDGGTVTLRWQTASERNLAAISVEQYREPDTWRTAGTVEPAGLPHRGAAYTFDVSDLPPGSHRFRLGFVERDGTRHYSSILDVDVPLETPYLISNPHPDPAQDRAVLEISVETPQRISVTLYDIMGRQVAHVLEAQMEENSRRTVVLDVSALAPGLYFCEVHGERFKEYRRITVLR